MQPAKVQDVASDWQRHHMHAASYVEDWKAMQLGGVCIQVRVVNDPLLVTRLFCMPAPRRSMLWWQWLDDLQLREQFLSSQVSSQSLNDGGKQRRLQLDAGGLP